MVTCNCRFISTNNKFLNYRYTCALKTEVPKPRWKSDYKRYEIVLNTIEIVLNQKYLEFDSMDGNAQFYEIFQSQVIADFSLCEKGHLMSQTEYM